MSSPSSLQKFIIFIMMFLHRIVVVLVGFPPELIAHIHVCSFVDKPHQNSVLMYDSRQEVAYIWRLKVLGNGGMGVFDFCFYHFHLLITCASIVIQKGRVMPDIFAIAAMLYRFDGLFWYFVLNAFYSRAELMESINRLEVWFLVNSYT